ncbi:gp53-like domain-containing protein [Yersinia ruckeri]|uniref:gp53-like domain-containing protein n=1 Tax=Yersinia ruckeri TaxID=29486 RepID=UPI003B8A6C93
MQKIGDIPNTRADSNGEFTDGNVAGGTPPTILPAEWFNTIQRELINVLVAGGVTPDTTKFNQLTTAISKLITDGGFLKTTNNLSEIKAAGQAAVAQTLANLGLGDAAKRTVGTGTTQIPDMSSFGSSKGGNGWMKLPSGFIFQCGVTNAGSTTREVTFPIPFPTTVVLVNHFDASWVTQTNGAKWGATNRTVTGFTGRTDVAGEGGQYLALGY